MRVALFFFGPGMHLLGGQKMQNLLAKLTIHKVNHCKSRRKVMIFKIVYYPLVFFFIVHVSSHNKNDSDLTIYYFSFSSNPECSPGTRENLN